MSLINVDSLTFSLFLSLSLSLFLSHFLSLSRSLSLFLSHFLSLSLSLFLFHFLSLSLTLFLVAVNVDSKYYIAKQTNLKIEGTVLLGGQLAFLTTCLLSYPFSFDVASPKSFFLFQFSIFLSLKIIKKDVKVSPSIFSVFLLFLFFYYVYRYTNVNTAHLCFNLLGDTTLVSSILTDSTTVVYC